MRSIFYILMILIISSYSHAQSGWYWQNQTPQTNSLTSVFFVNENTGYAAGYGSTLLKTIDAGLTWINLQCDGPYYIRSVYFVNQYTGYLCGYTLSSGIYAKVLKTTNSGDNWIVLEDPVTTYSGQWNSVYFINGQTGFLGGNYEKKIVRTTNAGQNWVQSSDLPFDVREVNNFEFIDQSTGFAVTGSWNSAVDIFSCAIFKTTNSGNNWTVNFKRDSPSIANMIDSFYDIKFTDQNTGYVSTHLDTLFKTTNGGNNWFKLPSLQSDNTYYRSLYFADNNTGYVNNASDYVSKTTNGGMNWSKYYFTPQIGVSQGDIVFSNISTGILAGTGGKIYRTTNSGINWAGNQSVNTNSLYDMTFTLDGTGFIVGDNNTILRSSDMGNIWKNVKIDSALIMNFNKVRFLDTNTGFIFGNNSKILKTTNEGLNWNLVMNNIPSMGKVLDVYFTNENNAYLIDAPGYIYKTTNGGNNWSTNGNPELIIGTAACFLDSNIIVAGDEILSSIFKTSNGGINWSPVYTNSPFNYFNDFAFINNYKGFAVGKSGTIAMTTNSGDNWTPVNTGITSDLLSITFYDSINGFISGKQGRIFKTTDGGLNWYSQISYTGNNLNKIYFTSLDTGYSIGNNGVIIKTITSGEQTNSIISVSNVPENFYLSQNYPNPFNPVTVIRYSIPRDGRRETQDVKLIIYDALGKEVRTLVNESQSAGSYSVEWYASGYPSGIYFYRLSATGGAGDFSETRRMILLK